MKESDFWGRMSDDYLRDNPEPPPLTDPLLAAFEKRTGVKLPKSLTDLLRIQNGGPLHNADFRFADKDYQVTYIKAVMSEEESHESIKSYFHMLDDDEGARLLQKKIGNLSKILEVAEPLDYPYTFALNYNHLNGGGEPTVWCIEWDDETPAAHQIANSFAEFLDGQYFGDEKPIVDSYDAVRLKLCIAEGRYVGKYRGEPKEGSGLLMGMPVNVVWQIYAVGDRLILFQESDWAGENRLTRAEVRKSNLAFNFPKLESYGVKVEPELAENIRPGVEIELLTKYDADLEPDCYELLLHVSDPGESQWVVDESLEYEGRWKNRKHEVVYVSVKSAAKDELTKVLEAVVTACSRGDA